MKHSKLLFNYGFNLLKSISFAIITALLIFFIKNDLIAQTAQAKLLSQPPNLITFNNPLSISQLPLLNLISLQARY